MKILIITHGAMAHGVLDSVKMIYGDDDRITTIAAYSEDFPTTESVKKVMTQLALEDDLVIFTDIMGGSVNNEAYKLMLESDINLVTNVNLGVIIEFLVRSRFEEHCDMQNLIRDILRNEYVMPIYCNDIKIVDEEVNYD